MSEIKKPTWGMKYELNPPKPLEAGYGCLMEIAAQATDLADKAIVDCIVQTAKEAGITDLYLLDKNFIRLAIMSAIEDTQNYKTSFEQIAAKYAKIQDKMLKGELVEVVLCKDCIYNKHRTEGKHILNWCGKFDNVMRDNDFCSFGEKPAYDGGKNMSKSEIEFSAENAQKLGDLISRSALWSDIMMLPHNGDIISSEEVEQAVTEAPAVDAVEVVRCRDCVNWAGDPAKKPEYAGCWRYGAAHGIIVHENGFCDKGMRRTGL